MRIVKTEVMFRRPHLNLMVSECESDGKTFMWDWVQRTKKQDAVVIGAIVPEPTGDRLVVIKEFRVPLDGYEWGMPAGLIDGDERIEDTVVRELKEETGFEVVKFLHVSPAVYNTPGITDEACYLAMVIAKPGGEAKLQKGEDITTHLLPREEVQNLLQSGEKMGAKAYLLMQQFSRFGTL
jgi:ADP-ribose pyrophosphatase